MVTEKFAKVISSLLKKGYCIEVNHLGNYMRDPWGKPDFKLTEEQLSHLKNKLSLKTQETPTAKYLTLA